MFTSIRIAALGVLLTVAGCHRTADHAAPGNSAAARPADNYLARIAKLPAAQQQLVLFRAIRDAGNDCQDVTKIERLADLDHRALWRVTCRGGGQWAVRIGADGIADVTGPPGGPH